MSASPAAPRSRASAREWASRVLLVGFGLLVVAAPLEAYLRWRNPFGQRLRGDRILLPTHTRVVLTQTENPKLEREIVVTRNGLGFRGPEPPADLDRRLSLVAVGGSTTECRYLSDGRDWPARLAGELDGSLRDVWLNNAGLDGHSTFGHLELLKQRVLPLRPEVVLFLIGINDVARDRLKYQDRALTERKDFSALARGFDWLARRSALLALVQNAWRARQAQRVAVIQPVLDLRALPHDASGRRGRAVARAHRAEFIPAYRGRVQALVDACRRAGSLPVLLTQPALYGPAIDDLTGVDLGTLEVDPQDGTNGRVAWATLEAYNDVLREHGAEREALVVDVARELPKSSRLFYDFVHLTGAGAAELARLVARELRPALEARFPERRRRP